MRQTNEVGASREGPEFWAGNFYLGNFKDVEIKKYLSKIIGIVSGTYYVGNCYQQILSPSHQALFVSPSTLT